MEKYEIEFQINELPPTINAIGRKHWAVLAKNARRWKDLIASAVRQCRPSSPLKNARLKLTRHSSVEPDFDGICSSFKHPIDGLVEAGVLVDDRFSNIGMPEYGWIKAKRGQGFITVKVEEV